jgi:hypothetical protein
MYCVIFYSEYGGDDIFGLFDTFDDADQFAVRHWNSVSATLLWSYSINKLLPNPYSLEA